MPFLSLCWVLAVALVAAWLLTGALLRYALVSRRLLDVPNNRSSHVVPTPRGGGVSFVLSFLTGLPVLTWLGLLPVTTAIALAGAGAMVAIIGFLDDRGHVAVRWRLLVHFGAALWLLVWFGGLPGGILSHNGTSWAAVASVLGLLGLVWLLNLYNFMDGIDGLAASEAICVAGGGALLYVMTDNAGSVTAPLLLVVSVVGFLLWNLPPARIFMGDVGSSFLGIVLGGLALQAAWHAPNLFWAWIILLGVFVTDASWTLLRRFARGERVYLAHRMHGYQHAARRFGGHRVVLLAVIAVNIGWLLPLAFCVAHGWLPAWLGVLASYGPLLALAVFFRAGEREKE